MNRDRYNRSWRGAFVERVLRRRLNAFAKSIIARAHEEGALGNDGLHEIAGRIDRRLWPERYR